jgi:methyltransferase family protein
VEIDPELHRLGTINAHGEAGKIALLEGDILDLRLLARLGTTPFDLIILNDVFEHVYDSAALFERLAALTGPTSIIYFGTPNGNSYQVIESEAHYSRPGLSLLPPSTWLNVVGPFNVYYRRLRHYQALFQTYGFHYLYLSMDMKLLGRAAEIIPRRFATLEKKLSPDAFAGDSGLLGLAISKLQALRREIDELISRKDWLGLHLSYGQHSWTGFATRAPHAGLQSQPAMVSLGQADDQGKPTAQTLDPGTLTGEDFVDLSAALVETQDGNPAAGRVALGEERRRACVTLTNNDGPKLGDFTRWRLRLPAEPARKYLVCVFVKNDYQSTSLTGRVEWRLAINNTPVHAEDIAVAATRRKLKAFVSAADHIEVELELRALRDCEAWHWGEASTTFIDGVMVQECPSHKSVS